MITPRQVPSWGAALCRVLETNARLVGVGCWFSAATVVLAIVVIRGEEPLQLIQRGVRGEQEVVEDAGQSSTQQRSSPVELQERNYF